LSRITNVLFRGDRAELAPRRPYAVRMTEPDVIAWLTEDAAKDQFGPVSPGLFSAHVERPDGSRLADGPRAAPIDTALAWAREQADCIIVSYDAPLGRPRHFSAGARQPPWAIAALPPWPPADLDLSGRRHPEWAHRGRGADSPAISWDVRVTVKQGWGEPIETFAARVAEGLQGGDGIELVDWIAGPGGGYTDADFPESGGPDIFSFVDGPGNVAVYLLLRASARTEHHAIDDVIATCEACVTQTLSDLNIAQREDMFGWTVNADAFPTGSAAAASNARIRENPCGEDYETYALPDRIVERCVAAWETIVEGRRSDLYAIGLTLDDGRHVSIRQGWNGVGIRLDPEFVRDKELADDGPVAVRDADPPLALLSSGEAIDAVRPMRDHSGFLVGLAISTAGEVLHIFNLGDELQAVARLPPGVLADLRAAA
jgi:hypothetical protein